MKTYVILMIVLVVAGTLFDVLHKKSARYFFDNWRSAKSGGTRQVGGGETVSLAIRTLCVEVLTSAEFCTARRRIAHLLPGRDGRRPFAQPGTGRKQSQIDHAGQPHFPQNVVPVVVSSAIEVDMRVRRLHGNVGSSEIQVRQKGPVLLRVGAQVLDELVGVEIAGEKIVRHGHPGDLHPVLEIAARHTVPPVQVEVAVGRSASGLGEGLVESPRDREFVRGVPQVPLAGGIGPVAVVLQQPGESHHAIAEHAFIPGYAILIGALDTTSHRPQARQMIVRAGQQHGAGGRAVHLGVETREPDALLCQAIQGRGIDFAAIGPQFGHADIVGNDDQKVGSVRLRRQYRGQQKTENESRSDHVEVTGIPFLSTG